MLTGPSGLDLSFTPRWIFSPGRFEDLAKTEGKKHSLIEIVVRTKEEAEHLMTKGALFGGVYHRVELFRKVGPDTMCPTCYHWGHTTYNCPNPDFKRCEICAGEHSTQNYPCTIMECKKRSSKVCIHTTLRCKNCGGKHMASSHSCKYYREAVVIARENREGWKARERIREAALQADEAENSDLDEDLEE